MVSIQEIVNRFVYCPESGVVSHRATRVQAGKVSNNHKTSYLRISVNGKQLMAHRIIWALHYGEWPKGQIDHIDGNGLNNRLSNLRDVSHSENQRNQRLHSRNKSGYRGVSLDRRTGKWQAHIWSNGKRIYLGRFDTALAAGEARTAAEAKYWI